MPGYDVLSFTTKPLHLSARLEFLGREGKNLFGEAWAGMSKGGDIDGFGSPRLVWAVGEFMSSFASSHRSDK